jgi:hypothetical protein
LLSALNLKLSEILVEWLVLNDGAFEQEWSLFVGEVELRVRGMEFRGLRGGWACFDFKGCDRAAEFGWKGGLARDFEG